MAKPDLDAELKRRCAAAGRSAADLARDLNLPPGTLRNWLHRNAYPEAVLEAVLERIGWDVSLDQLRKRYAFGVVAHPRGQTALPGVTLLDLFAAIDDRRKQLETLFGRFGRDVLSCFAAMGPDDLFAFTSLNVTPWEFAAGHGKTLGRAAAEAVARGGLCVYLRPTERVLDGFVRLGVPRTFTAHLFVDQVRKFRLKVAEHLETDGGRTHADAVRTAADRVLLLPCGGSTFWQPGFSWGYFQTPTPGGGVSGRLSVKLPTDFTGVLMLPNDYELSAQFRRFVADAVEAGGNDPPPDAPDLHWTAEQRAEVRRRLAGEVGPV